MRPITDRRFTMLLFTIWSIANTLFAQLHAAGQYFPPNLVVQKIDGDKLTLSALVVAEDGATIPDFTIGGQKQAYTLLNSPYLKGWKCYRYLFDISKDGATFDFGISNFTIPSFADGLKCFYTSCADGQPGVSENWKKFYAYANQMRACVHLKGGDNIPYPDEGLDAIFYNNWPEREISEEEKQKVINLYSKLYLQALGELPKEGTIIPAIVQRDDHDCYDGRGSLGDSEKRPIPTFIRDVADALFLRLQLHMSEEEKDAFGYFGGKDNYSKIYQFCTGETILQVDGRGERTQQQICSEKTWKQIWSQLDEIKDCKTLYVMLGVPIAFPAMPKAEAIVESIVESIQKHPAAANLTKKFLGQNRDGSPEPLDDVYYDHWDAHLAERDLLIQKLQEFSTRTKTKVALVSGDVHNASTGVITGTNKPTIYQVASSAVGSTAPSRAAIATLGALNHLEKSKTSYEDEIFLVPSLSGPDGQPATFVGKRNCCIINGNDVRIYDEDGIEYKSNILTTQPKTDTKCCAAS